MGKRPDSAVVIQRKYDLVRAAIRGRQSASSTTLSASYGLAPELVRNVLRETGVRDDG